MNSQDVSKSSPNLSFSHIGISVMDMAPMRDFYTNVLGFFVTDEGMVGPMAVLFLSRDPKEHHQIVLAAGRPRDLPANTMNPGFGPSINQVSFRIGSLQDMREINARLDGVGLKERFSANHGNAWSTYAKDPEGNTLEFFMDTEWYIPQPCLEPLDLSKSDAEIYEATKKMCESQPGCVSIGDYQARIAELMGAKH